LDFEIAPGFGFCSASVRLLGPNCAAKTDGDYDGGYGGGYDCGYDAAKDELIFAHQEFAVICC
jgi:hypothetical protein